MMERILCVDDDEKILRSYERQLSEQFQIETAIGPEQGLQAVSDRGPFAVVVSDMCMPGMNGIEFLRKARENAPYTVQIMLTGNADQQTAMDAINEGHIFRFLTKPCPAESLTKALEAGIQKYRQVVSEKALVEKAISGDAEQVHFFEKSVTVADIMTKEVHTLTIDDKLQDAVTLFQEFKIHHAPVIDPEQKDVLGIVSDRDVLRATPRHLGTAMEGEKDQHAMRTDLQRSIMTRNPIHVSQTSSLSDVLSLLLQKRIDCLLVYDDPAELQGIVTSRDFLKEICLYLQAWMQDDAKFRLADMGRGLSTKEIFRMGARCVEDVMSRKVMTLQVDSHVKDAMELIQDNKVRHIPIVNDNQRLVGIISDREILKALSPVNGQAAAGNDNQDKFRGRLFATEASDQILEDKLGLLMSSHPVTVTPDKPLKDAIATLLDGDISCLPVVDTNRDITGMFTSTDVLQVAWAAFRFGDQSV